MTPKQKAWLIISCTFLATVCVVTTGAAAGGCKLWIAIMTGIGAGASAVLHAVMRSPNDADASDEQAAPPVRAMVPAGGAPAPGAAAVPPPANPQPPLTP